MKTREWVGTHRPTVENRKQDERLDNKTSWIAWAAYILATKFASRLQQTSLKHLRQDIPIHHSCLTLDHGAKAFPLHPTLLNYCTAHPPQHRKNKPKKNAVSCGPAFRSRRSRHPRHPRAQRTARAGPNSPPPRLNPFQGQLAPRPPPPPQRSARPPQVAGALPHA